MGKMGELLERRLDENKYAMYEALRGLLRDYSTDPNSDIFYEACLKARQVIAKVEGK